MPVIYSSWDVPFRVLFLAHIVAPEYMFFVLFSMWCWPFWAGFVLQPLRLEIKVCCISWVPVLTKLSYSALSLAMLLSVSEALDYCRLCVPCVPFVFVVSSLLTRFTTLNSASLPKDLIGWNVWICIQPSHGKSEISCYGVKWGQKWHFRAFLLSIAKTHLC
jgi:hypothetical protein